MRPFGTPLLCWLACLLPLLALLSAQLEMFCDEQGGCAVPARAGAWLLWPLILAWIAVLVALVLRGLRRCRSGTRPSP